MASPKKQSQSARVRHPKLSPHILPLQPKKTSRRKVKFLWTAHVFVVQFHFCPQGKSYDFLPAQLKFQLDWVRWRKYRRKFATFADQKQKGGIFDTDYQTSWRKETKLCQKQVCGWINGQGRTGITASPERLWLQIISDQLTVRHTSFPSRQWWDYPIQTGSYHKGDFDHKDSFGKSETEFISKRRWCFGKIGCEGI